MGRRTYMLVALLAVWLGAVSKFIQQRNEKAALIGDTHPLTTTGVHHFVSLLQLQNDGPQRGASPAIAGLDDAVKRHNGRLVYLGKCLYMLQETGQFHLPTCDVVAHTTWDQAVDFEAFRAEIDQSWAVHRVQGFSRPIVPNLFMAAATHGLLPLLVKAKAAVLGTPGYSDLSVQSRRPESVEGAAKNGMGHTPVEQWDQMQKIADLMDQDPEGPLVVWNWQCSTPTWSRFLNNLKYSLGAITGIVYHGAGPMHLGGAQQDYPGKDGTFNGFAAVYFPTRQLYGEFFRSRWMFEVIQDKDTGDGLAVLTAPVL